MSNEQNSTLGDALPREMARVRDLMPAYQDIGPAGTFALMMMHQDLNIADRAIAAGDVAAMIRAYESLKGYKS